MVYIFNKGPLGQGVHIVDAENKVLEQSAYKIDKWVEDRQFNSIYSNGNSLATSSTVGHLQEANDMCFMSSSSEALAFGHGQRSVSSPKCPLHLLVLGL